MISMEQENQQQEQQYGGDGYTPSDNRKQSSANRKQAKGKAQAHSYKSKMDEIMTKRSR